MADIVQGNSNEARLLGDERFLRRVAYRYYEDGNSQETIAEAEFCSRQTVSKALQRARERDIVRISIVPDMRVGYLRNLSRQARVQLGLEDLILVPGSNMNTVPANDFLEDVVVEITTAAADYLDQLLTSHDILAVSGGRQFMRNLVRYLKPAKPLPHMNVVATIGFASSHTSFGDANMIAYDIATAYGAQHVWFPCPAILGSAEEVRQVRQLPIVSESYNMIARANVIVTSLWVPQVDEGMGMREFLSQEQVKAIQALQPKMDINHWLFDADGRCINELLEPSPYFLSGLEVPRLKKRIQEDNIKVILIAGGSPSYVPAIRVAVNAGLVNILITDHITAQLLLE